MSFKNRCTISSSYEFQAHQQRSQRRCCFSQNALLWFEVLPDAHRFVAGAPRCSAMQRKPLPGRRAVCNSPSEGTRFRQSRQSRPEHPGVSDGNWGCCWWGEFALVSADRNQLYSFFNMHCVNYRYGTVEIYWSWMSHEDLSAQLTPIHGSQDASLYIQNAFHAVWWISKAPV